MPFGSASQDKSVRDSPQIGDVSCDWRRRKEATLGETWAILGQLAQGTPMGWPCALQLPASVHVPSLSGLNNSPSYVIIIVNTNHRVVYRIYLERRVVAVCAVGVRKQGDVENIYRKLASVAETGRLAEQIAAVLRKLLP